MPIDPDGSRPEKMDFGGGSLDWTAQNYTAREVDHRPGGKWVAKKKCGLPDQKKVSEAYRSGWDRIFGNKETA